MVGHESPATRLTTLDGDLVGLEEFHGKNVAILFWATWCAHSRPAVEEMEELAEQQAARGDSVFWAVSVDKAENLDVLKSRISYQNLKGLKHAFSGNDVYDEAYTAFQGRDLPYFVVVDKNGVVQVVSEDIGPVQDFFAAK